MTVQEMLQTHPHPFADPNAVARCIEECVRCATTCTSCADACLSEQNVSELARCIRLNLDCADACEAAARIVTRQTEAETLVIRDIVVACGTACRICAEECERHAGQHDHCRVCAEVCRRCEQACQDLLSTIR
jgi:hypothetical protein